MIKRNTNLIFKAILIMILLLLIALIRHKTGNLC